MRRFLTYVVFLVVWLDTTSLNQLVKLPILVSHFIEHQQTRSGLTFVQFISMHYWGEDDNDNDNDRDMQLPFRKIDFNNMQALFFPTVREPIVKQVYAPEKSVYLPAYYSNWPNPTLKALFRPPRV
ncbi:MAG: hypothetical protein INR73_13710 [Williamsia sp.]|nr:hypothetical protein [Williamsia sp.]